MINQDKADLRYIIMEIPLDEIYNNTIKFLHIKYGYGYTYGTFRKYLKALRRKRKND